MKAKLGGVLLDTAVYYAIHGDSEFFVFFGPFKMEVMKGRCLYTSPDRKSIARIYQGSQGALYKGAKI